MNHRAGFNKLSKNESHRKAMTKNMVTSLFRYGRIETTKAKAKAVQVSAEKMITRAKVDSVHNRRIIAKSIHDKAILAKLFVEIGPSYVERNGGYTRILKIGYRQGDAAEMVIIELLKDDEEAGGSKKPKKKKAAPAKPAEKPAEKAKEPAVTEAAAPVEVKEEEPAEEQAVLDTPAADNAAAAETETPAPEAAEVNEAPAASEADAEETKED